MRGVADLLQHVDDRLVGAAVRRPPKRGNAGRHRRVGVAARAAGKPHGRSARVLFVVGVQDEQEVERLGVQRVDLVGLARHGEEHVQHVGRVVEVIARVDEGLTQRVLVRRRRDRRELGDHAVRENLAVPVVVDVGRVVVEGRERSDDRRDHRHRVRVVVEPAIEPEDPLVQHRVARDRGRERLELLAARQFAFLQQVRDLEEARVLGQLLDRVAAVEQDARVAVDVGDGARRRRGRHEAGVVGEDALVLGQRADVERVRPDGADEGGEFARAAGGPVGELILLAGHRFPASQTVMLQCRNQGWRGPCA